jgi:hypothetical protein
MNAITRIPFCLALFVCVLLAPLASAQKVDRKYREFPAIGVEFKPLKNFSDVPVGGRLGSLGIIGQFESESGAQVKFVDGGRHEYKPALKVIHLELAAPTTGTGQEDEGETDDRRGALDFVKSLYGSGLKDSNLEVEISEIKASKKMVGERAEMLGVLNMRYGQAKKELEIVFDVYTFALRSEKVVFVWDYPAEKKLRKKWGAAIRKSMRTFQLMKEGASDAGVGGVTSDSSYEDLLKYHRHEVEQTPGWRLVETPSKAYLIKTNEEGDKGIKEVIQRIEASRKLYEKDFPSATPITSVSVVRICATRDEFNTYGQTGGGVAGYFNPRSEELVLFFGSGSKSMTLSVMAHEGFHQYCHFLFSRAEAHRWFDEGHGDYYGAWKMKGRKLIQEEDMKEGLARVPEIKQMFNDETIKPLSEHIRYDHQSWQTQGPTNVSCYAQSFALVYYLREGADGKVARRYWNKEYATIIPNYMAELDRGFQEVYAAVRKEGQDMLDALGELDPEGADADKKEAAQRRIDAPWNFARGEKDKIWKAAMAASWGQIDEEEFEKLWLSYIEKEL